MRTQDCNYTLEPVKIPDEVLDMISTADLVRELEKRGNQPLQIPKGCYYVVCDDEDGRKISGMWGPAKILVVKE